MAVTTSSRSRRRPTTGKTTRSNAEHSSKIVIRNLRENDLERGFLETLASLSDVHLTPAAAREVLASRPANEHTFVAIRNGRVVGTTSLLVDQKFIHGGGRVGNIEDVAVSPDARHCGIGTALVKHAVQRARALGCYKVILHCFSNLSGFYQRMGFRDYNIGMRLDLSAA